MQEKVLKIKYLVNIANLIEFRKKITLKNEMKKVS